MTIKDSMIEQGKGCFLKEMKKDNWNKIFSKLEEISGKRYNFFSDIPDYILEIFWDQTK